MEIKIVVYHIKEGGTCVYKLHRVKSRVFWKHYKCCGGLRIQEVKEFSESLGLKYIISNSQTAPVRIPFEPEHLE